MLCMRQQESLGTILSCLLARASAGYILRIVLDKDDIQVAAIICWQWRRGMSACLEHFARLLGMSEACNEFRMPDHSHVCSPELSELAAATLLLS